MPKRFIPYGDKVLLLPIEGADVSRGGIIVPENAKERPNSGIVLAVGEGKYNDKGILIPVKPKVGEEVYYSKYGGNAIKQDIDGEEKEVLIMAEEDVFGRIEEYEAKA